MTTPRYADPACAAEFQERGEASSAWANSPDDNAWIVNFNNGNSDNYHRDNKAFVRAVRAVSPGECQGASSNGEVALRDLYAAWKCARRKKRPSIEQLQFEAHWSHSLIDLQERIAAGTWSPSPTTCFVATRPKAREIHAPAYADRVVHHWLVPQLERIYDASFAHDSYGCGALPMASTSSATSSAPTTRPFASESFNTRVRRCGHGRGAMLAAMPCSARRRICARPRRCGGRTRAISGMRARTACRPTFIAAFRGCAARPRQSDVSLIAWSTRPFASRGHREHP